MLITTTNKHTHTKRWKNKVFIIASVGLHLKVLKAFALKPIELNCTELSQRKQLQNGTSESKNDSVVKTVVSQISHYIVSRGSKSTVGVNDGTELTK